MAVAKLFLTLHALVLVAILARTIVVIAVREGVESSSSQVAVPTAIAGDNLCSPQCTSFFNYSCPRGRECTFTAVARAIAAEMKDDARALPVYENCMRFLRTYRRSRRSEGEELRSVGEILASGLPFPITLDVEKKLDEPLYAVSLRVDLEACRDDRVAPLCEKLRRGGATEEKNELDDYLEGYETLEELRERAPLTYAMLLEQVFDGDFGELRYVHRNFEGDRLEGFLSEVTAAEVRQAALFYAGDALLELFLYGSGGSLLFQKQRQAPLAGLLQQRLPYGATERAPARFGIDPPDPRRLGAEVGEEERCIAFARSLDVLGLNERYAARVDLGRTAREAHALSQAILAHVKAILIESNIIGSETKARALEKLSKIVFYPLQYREEALDAWDRDGREALASREAARNLPSAILARFAGEQARALRRARSRARFLPDSEADRQRVTYFGTVNAWYDPTANDVTFPPGILRPPVFEPSSRTAAVVAGSMGVVVGHELGHAFDNGGRLFDADGSLVWNGGAGWWNEEDLAGFASRMTCLAERYGHPCGRDDYGMHTMGEDMADQIGVRAALRMWQHEIYENNATAAELEDVRLFFDAYAGTWCAELEREQACELVRYDVHALPSHRVDVTLAQLEAFATAYRCATECAMTPPLGAMPCVVY